MHSFLFDDPDHNTSCPTDRQIFRAVSSNPYSPNPVTLGNYEEVTEVICSFATLDDDALQKVKTVENETGETLLAYDCFRPADVNEENLHKIKAAEKSLCRTLIAVKTGHEKKSAEPSSTV